MHRGFAEPGKAVLCRPPPPRPLRCPLVGLWQHYGDEALLMRSGKRVEFWLLQDLDPHLERLRAPSAELIVMAMAAAAAVAAVAAVTALSARPMMNELRKARATPLWAAI